MIHIKDFHCTGSIAPPAWLKNIRFIRRSNVAYWTDDGPRKMFFLATRLHEVSSRQRRLKDSPTLHFIPGVPGSDSDVLNQWNIVPSDAASEPSDWYMVRSHDGASECHGDGASECDDDGASSALAWLEGDERYVDSYAHASSAMAWLEERPFVPDMTVEWLEYGPSLVLPRLQ